MAHYETYKINFLILSFILNVPILYETGLGLAVTAISQYITSWLLTGKTVSSLDFTLQILIFPYYYHGVKAAGNENPLLHNGVWSFLHRDNQAFTSGLCCSTAVSLQVPRGRDGACGEASIPICSDGAVQPFSISCVTHSQSECVSHQAVLRERLGIFPWLASLACHSSRRAILWKQIEGKWNLSATIM